MSIGEMTKRAIIEIAYDSGVINRCRSEDDALATATAAIQKSFGEDALLLTESFLKELSEDELLEFATGEWVDRDTQAENMANLVLNHAFENLF